MAGQNLSKATMQTRSMMTSITRAARSAAAASQRGLLSASVSGGAADAAAVQRAMAGAFANKFAQDAAHRKPPAAVLEAALPQSQVELAQQVQAQLHRQMAAVEAAAVESPSATMQAAAEHLKGIPLRSKREYKALIADWVARRQ
jgi:hypothetical protein